MKNSVLKKPPEIRSDPQQTTEDTPEAVGDEKYDNVESVHRFKM